MQPLKPGLCVLLFVIGATSYIDIPLVARLPLSEIIAFASLPVLLSGFSMNPYRDRLNKVLVILFIWVCGTVLSDIINRSSMLDAARGLFKPLFCLLWIFFITVILTKEMRAFIFYGVGLILGAIQNFVAPVSPWVAHYADASEYGAIAFTLAPLGIAIAAGFGTVLYQKSKLVVVALFLVCGMGLFVSGAPRNFAATLLVAGFLVGYIWYTTSNTGRRARLKPSMGKVVSIAVFLAVLGYGLFMAYIFAADRGWLGAEQWAKLQIQSATSLGKTPLGIIMGGRTGVFAAILAILDNPILGYGSWSGVTLGSYLYEAAYIVGADAASLARLASGEVGGAGHSVLFQAWVENGILAAVALSAIGWITVQQVFYILRIDHRLAPLILTIAMMFLWAFLFSPFSTITRFHIGFFLAMYMTDELQRRVLMRNAADFYQSMLRRPPPPSPTGLPVPTGVGMR
ncbi:MAG: hypothetical protein ACFB20_02925 [Opitutales bacterium]